jgi:hypothetical protein
VLFCSVNYTSLRRPRWVTVSCELDVLSRRPNMGASPQQIYAFPHWQPAYHGCAGRNGPPQAVCTRTSCRKSIFESLQEIADSPVHQVERQAIFDANGTLAFLKRDAQSHDSIVKRRQTKKVSRKRANKLVISVGTLPELLWLREAVLKNAGFDVITITDERQALAKIKTVDCGVLLLCYSIDDETRQQLTQKYREACPDGRIVAITNAPLQPPPEADKFVYGVEGPEALIAAVGGA